FLTHDDDLVYVTGGDGERVLAHLADGDAIGDRRRRGQGDPAPLVEGRAHAGDRRGLDADHAYLGPPGLDGQRHPRDEAAAADGQQHGVDVGELIEQLEADRALAGDDARVVEG